MFRRSQEAITQTPETSRFYAQHGEDKILMNYFNNAPRGVYVEVGAYDGVQMSNTYYFEQAGWTGLLIEANPEVADVCREMRPRSQVIPCAVVSPGIPGTVRFEVAQDMKANSALSVNPWCRAGLRHRTGRIAIREIEVPARTLDDILTEYNVESIDFLTIDVEGFEFDVLSGFTASAWNPKIIIVERTGIFPDARVMRYMHANCYMYTFSTGVNDWFCCQSTSRFRRIAYRLLLVGTLYIPRVPALLASVMRRRSPVD